MKTKLSFRIFNRRTRKYLRGWEEATKYFLGIANDPKDYTIELTEEDLK